MSEYRLIRDFGASGRGYPYDDTMPFVNWVTAINANGGRGIPECGKFYLPQLKAKLGQRGAVFGNGCVKITGEGFPGWNFGRGSIFQLVDTGLFATAMEDSIQLEGFGVCYLDAAGNLANAPTGTGGVFYLDDGPSRIQQGGNIDSVIRDVNLLQADIAFQTRNAYRWRLSGLKSDGHVRAGAYLENVNVPGSGDNLIDGNTTFSSQCNAHIYLISGGGFKMANAKLNGGLIGVLVDYTGASSQAISPLSITGTSIEGNSQFSVLFQRIAGVEQVGNVTFSGNEFQCGICAQGSGAAPWIRGGVIGDNYIGASPYNKTCVSIDGWDGLMLGNNFLDSPNFAATGIAIGPATAHIALGTNGKGTNVA